MRIVSLLPSATEIVLALGLEAQLVGVTHECDFPPAARGKRRVTKTLIPIDAPSDEIDRLVRAQLAGGQALYTLNFEALADLQPDLIVTQTLCRVCAVSDREVADALRRLPGPPQVVYLEPTRLDDVLRNISEVAEAARVAERGTAYVAGLRARIEAVRARAAAAAQRLETYPCGTPRRDARARPVRVVVLEWLDPLFSCGHWTPDLVELAGGVEPLVEAGQRSRALSAAELAAADPDVLVIACCGYDTLRTLRDVPALLGHEEIAGMRCVRAGQVFVTDGNAYFSRPGPRLVDAVELLAHTIAPHGHRLPRGIPEMVRVTTG